MRGTRGRVSPQTAKKLPKIRKNREREEKSERKGKNWEGSFILPLLIDIAGNTTDYF